MVVAMSHGRCAFVEPEGAPNVTDLALGIFQPASAVVVFFVLSGYVLGISLSSDANYLAFAVRRLLRILPAFIVSVLFAYLVVSSLRIEPAPTSTTSFFQSVFWPTPTWGDVYDNLLLINSHVNGPTWSIWPELVGSAMLPVVVMIHGKAPRKYQWLVFAIVAVVLAFSQVRLFLYFYAGYFIAPRLSSLIAERPIARSMVLLGGLALLIGFGHDPVDFKSRTIIPSGLGATLVVAAIASNSLPAAGDRPAPVSGPGLLQLLSAALAGLLSLRDSGFEDGAIFVRHRRKSDRHEYVDRCGACVCLSQLSVYRAPFYEASQNQPGQSDCSEHSELD